jgi:hypothetical protein
MLLRKTIGRDGLNNYAYPSGQTDRITTNFDWTLDCISAEVKVNVKLPNYASVAHSLLDQLTSGVDIPGEGFAMIGQNRMLERFVRGKSLHLLHPNGRATIGNYSRICPV